jgi:hypothetical protein
MIRSHRPVSSASIDSEEAFRRGFDLASIATPASPAMGTGAAIARRAAAIARRAAQFV